jgi:exopolysaccharide biosynthesis protein
MKLRHIFYIMAMLGVACSSKESTTPEWPWTDPENHGEEQTTDPNPAVIEKGWTNVSSAYSSLPEGIQVYKSPSAIDGVKTVAYIAVADLSRITWDVWSIDDPNTQGTDQTLKTPSEVYETTSAPVLVNGGYFFSEGGKRYNASVAVSNGKVYGVNLNYASQDWVTYYYPTRGVFYEKAGKLSAGWTYYTSSGQHYLYGIPADNAWDKAPAQAPDASFPETAATFEATTAIGAGPVLVHGGEVVNSWKAELFYGDGSDDKMPEARHPRTAIGCTSSRLILFVCEGRGMTEGVAGLTTGEVASVMKSLGCKDALNLDGGGSSCLLVGGKSTIKESDGHQRAVGSVIMLKTK